MRIRDKEIGAGRCFVIAELGINHNGSMDLAREMIRQAASAGADAVKFQRRTLELNYTAEEMAAPRKGPWGATNGDLKTLLEFKLTELRHLRDEAHELGLAFIVSPWDVPAVLDCFNLLNVDAIKIPSARLHREDIAEAVIATRLPVILSTGMSDLPEVGAALNRLWSIDDRLAVMACVSAYPCAVEDLNLTRIVELQRIVETDDDGRTEPPIGYSSHAVSPWPALCAVAMGAEIVECHVTLDRSMWGSDQSASLEFGAFAKLVTEIRDFERGRGSGELKVLPCEEAVRAKLRR